jgi:hypothetical protein
LDCSEFKCKWIDTASLWNVADETRNKYWPESRLPVSTEEILPVLSQPYISNVLVTLTDKINVFFSHSEV